MATLHINDRRHFPLSFVAVRTIKTIALLYVLGNSPEHLVYEDHTAGLALDALADELNEDYDATTGARRFSALIFAMAVAPMYWTPEEIGWFQPMR